MNTPTYKEQFDKLTTAYINDEVNPFDGCRCFVGNMLNKNLDWLYGRRADFTVRSSYSEFDFLVREAKMCIKIEANGLYTLEEIYTLEKLFLDTICLDTVKYPYPFHEEEIKSRVLRHKNYENALFHAFEVTLEALRNIHISKGENVDEQFIFTKRVLQNV